jgi:hypothetical protein
MLPQLLNHCIVKELRLKARVKAREDAKCIIELASSSHSDEDQYGCRDVYWSKIRDYALSQAPLPKVKPVVVKARPMTAEQAKEFEKERFPFGANSGMMVSDAMSDNDGYCQWLANQSFVDDLRRYLACLDGD